jgi:hypothetical protein
MPYMSAEGASSQDWPQYRPNFIAVVTLRCDRCARDLGTKAPALAICNRTEGGWWQVIAVQRMSRDMRDQPPVAGYQPFTGRGHGLDLRAPGQALACRRCKARPRVSRRNLVELVEEALAAGRRDAYV